MNNNKTRRDQALETIKINRIILPIILGLGVVGYLLWKSFDPESFKNISWDFWAFSWISLGLFFYVIRHLSYAYRLKILSEGKFGWKKCIELIFIWEFASTVSPTSLGGSAVALVLLSQEKIKAAKTVTIVLYSVVLDTLFFVISLPLLYFWLGPKVIRPGMVQLNDIDGYGLTFLIVFLAMTTYGSIFFYGLFYRPQQIKKLILYISKIKILNRFKHDLERTSGDIVNASKQLKLKPLNYHVKSIIATFSAWFFKFSLMSCIIYALIKDLPINLNQTALIYGRYESMFAITAFSPTPGGSGLAEYLFGGFFSDIIPENLSIVLAFLWRLISYYSYLIFGVIIVPHWIRHVLKIRKKNRSIHNSN